MKQTPDEQREFVHSIKPSNEKLTALAKMGDKAALALLWEQNKGLLYILCRRYFIRYTERAAAVGLTWEDIEQEGYFIIYEAVRLYKPQKAVQFVTLLPYIVRKHLQHILGIKTKRAQNEPLNQSISLDLPIDIEDDTGSTRGEMVPDPSAMAAFESIEQAIFVKQLHNDLEKAFSKIDPKQATALRGIYYNGYSIEQLAEVLECTPHKARALQTSAIIDIRRKAVFLWKYAEEIRTSYAYRGTGFSAWAYGGSVQEKVVERIEQEQSRFAQKSAQQLTKNICSVLNE